MLLLDVARNPDNLESVARLLDAYQKHPDIFRNKQDDSGAQQQEAVKQRVERSLDLLADRDDSRSKLVLYRFLQSEGRVEQALDVLLPAAEQASERLASLQPDQVGDSPAGFAEDQPQHYYRCYEE